MSLKAKIEAVIYASEEPVTLAQLTNLLGEEAEAELAAQESVEQAPLELDAGAPEKPEVDEKKLARERDRRLRDYFRSLLDQLIADYANGDRGLEIREVAGGYRLATRPEYHDTVRGFVKALKPPLKLTLQSLETLAVIAYKQPVTAPEISEIRGVDSSGVLGSLLLRKLITTAGRKQVIGRPILYKTTKDFLVRFGLKDINELPSIEEFEKMAGELNIDINEAIQEEIPMESDADGADDLRRAEDEPPHDVAEEAIVDGRISALDPNYEDDSPSELEAEIQASEKG